VIAKGKQAQENMVIASVRRALGREADSPAAPRPPVLPSREAGDQDAEIELLLSEIDKLAGQTLRITPESIEARLAELVKTVPINSATCWNTPWLQELGVAAKPEPWRCSLHQRSRARSLYCRGCTSLCSNPTLCAPTCTRSLPKPGSNPI
jgi:hypothetical protein